MTVFVLGDSPVGSDPLPDTSNVFLSLAPISAGTSLDNPSTQPYHTRADIIFLGAKMGPFGTGDNQYSLGEAQIVSNLMLFPVRAVAPKLFPVRVLAAVKRGPIPARLESEGGRGFL